MTVGLETVHLAPMPVTALCGLSTLRVVFLTKRGEGTDTHRSEAGFGCQRETHREKGEAGPLSPRRLSD